MPCDYSLYPADWKVRVARILVRAGHVCEFCAVPNHAAIFRLRADGFTWRHPHGGDMCEADPAYRATNVVLTVAHLDRTGPPGPDDGPLDCPDDRLAALCQRCHLIADKERHRAKRKDTIFRKKQQLSLGLPLEK